MAATLHFKSAWISISTECISLLAIDVVVESFNGYVSRKFQNVTVFFTSTKELIFSHVSVCLPVNRIINKTKDQIFTKMLWNGWT